MCIRIMAVDLADIIRSWKDVKQFFSTRPERAYTKVDEVTIDGYGTLFLSDSVSLSPIFEQTNDFVKESISTFSNYCPSENSTL